MTTNILIIFGYCFIFELFILVTVVFSSILRSFVDRKTKERNYKYMVKNEEKLRKEVEKEKTNKDEKNIKDIFEFIIDKNTGKLELKEPVNLSEESIEFKIKSIDIEPEEGSKIRRGNYEIDFIPISYVGDSKKQYSYCTIQIPIYIQKDGKEVPSGETETVIINFEINPETGEYINNSSKSIRGIHLMCLIIKDISEEEKRESDFNKKLTTSKDVMNELLENAVSEGLNENNENREGYQYRLWNHSDSPSGISIPVKTSISDFDPVKDELEFEFISFTYREDNKEKIIYADEIKDNKFTVSVENNIFILTKMISGYHISISYEPNGFMFFNQDKTSSEVETVEFMCIHKKDVE